MYNEDGTLNVGRLGLLAVLATFPWLRNTLLVIGLVFLFGGLMAAAGGAGIGIIISMVGGAFIFGGWLPAFIMAATARRLMSNVHEEFDDDDAEEYEEPTPRRRSRSR